MMNAPEPFGSGWTGAVAVAQIIYVAIAILLILLDGRGGRALDVFNLYSDSLASICVAVLAGAAARGASEPAARRTWWLLTGALAGFTSGMMGVGGGAIMIPAMVLLAGFDQHVAQGTSLLVMVPTGSAGAYSHWKLGNVRTALLWGLVPGVLVGSFLGGTVAHSLSDGALRLIFAAVLIWTGVRYLRTKQPALS